MIGMKKGPARRVSGRIPSLDGLRAVSIAMVVGFHILNAVWRPRTGVDYHGPWSIIANGGIGVSIFFVISGFLITSLLQKEVAGRGSIRLLDFYTRRSFRIWPAFYAYLAVVAVLHWFKVVGLDGKRDLLASALFVLNYVPRSGSTWLGHTWSLAVEEQFYMFWPLAFIFSRSSRHVFIAVAIMCAVPMFRFAELVFFPQSYLVSRIWETGHTRIDTIMAGCLVALIWDRQRFQQFLGKAFRLRLHVLSAILLFANWPILQRYAQPTVAVTFGYTIESLSILLPLIWLIKHSETLVGKFFNSRLLVHLGTISYSLYLWNALFCTPSNKTWTGKFPANLLCSLALAEASRAFVELPFLKLRGKLARSKVIAADPTLSAEKYADSTTA